MFQEYSKQEKVLADGIPSVLRGTDLEAHLIWEDMFRKSLSERGFSLLNLPTILPSYRFESEVTGESMLPAAPRFRDGEGRDWLLRSDMTAFSAQVIRTDFSREHSPIRVGYCGKVFGIASSPRQYLARGSSHGFSHDGIESFEYGAEIVDRLGSSHEEEAVSLALELADSFGYTEPILIAGHSEVWTRVLEHALKFQSGVFSSRTRLQTELRLAFLRREGSALSAIPELDEVIRDALEWSGLRRLRDSLARQFPRLQVIVDPFLLRSSDFYSGLTFELFARVPGLPQVVAPQRVGAGGRYDRYLKHFAMNASAVGFKILDPGTHQRNLHSQSSSVADTGSFLENHSPRAMRIAVPKGRLQGKVFEAFSSIGIFPELDPSTTRRLVIQSRCGQAVFLLVKNTDVASYIESGGADIGVCGSDILDESSSALVRPVTFSFGETRLCLAGLKGKQEAFWGSAVRTVASKYCRTASRLLEDIGFEARVVPLQGSVELASVLGIAQAVVDLVETGRTLDENGLEVYRELGLTKVHLITTQSLWVHERNQISLWYEQWRKQGVVKDSQLVFCDWPEKESLS